MVLGNDCFDFRLTTGGADYELVYCDFVGRGVSGLAGLYDPQENGYQNFITNNWDFANVCFISTGKKGGNVSANGGKLAKSDSSGR